MTERKSACADLSFCGVEDRRAENKITQKKEENFVMFYIGEKHGKEADHNYAHSPSAL